jgi:hypothetical protein
MNLTLVLHKIKCMVPEFFGDWFVGRLAHIQALLLRIRILEGFFVLSGSELAAQIKNCKLK